MLTVDAVLWWGMPELQRYCGLSGMLNTLFLLLLARLWRRSPLVPLLALALGCKLLMELSLEQSLLLHTPWPALPQTHLAGTLGGVLLLGLEKLLGRRQ